MSATHQRYGTILVLSILLLASGAAVAAAGGYVYLAEAPGTCIMDTPVWGQHTVYLYSDDVTDAVGVSFRLESDLFGPEDVDSVVTPAGVTIISGDVVSGITLSFTPRALAHEPVLRVYLSDRAPVDPGFVGWVSTRDVTLYRLSGTSAVDDFSTWFNNVDCFYTSPVWFTPDTLDVAVGTTGHLVFRAVVTTPGYPGNASCSIIDPADWVLPPLDHAIYAGCQWCQWDITTVDAPILVPEQTPDGTLDDVTLHMTWYGGPLEERHVVLRAVSTVATQRKTFGALKAMYRRDD